MQSLPMGCKFSIISFGDRFELHKDFMETENKDGVYEYNDETLEKTLAAIAKFQADFGGTELDQPLVIARKLTDEAQWAKQARVFVLTDGQVWDSENVFNKVNDLPPHLRISTFGIGRSFDEQLVSVLAKKGRGSASRIYDLEQGSLSAAAVKALNRAMYPSLNGCNMQWSVDEEKEELSSVFYNELVSSYRLVDSDKLTELTFTFWCDKSMDDGSEIAQTFNR